MSPLLLKDVRMGRPRCRNGSPSGYSLPEILIVAGLVTVVAAILIPVISSLRSQAQGITCQNNVRQITAALLSYSREWGDRFPPNISTPAPGKFWYDPPRVVPYLQPIVGAAGRASGGVLVCPRDEGSVRSYAMNAWAGSPPDVYVTQKSATIPESGKPWTSLPAHADRSILLAEAWSGSRVSGTSDWAAAATIGFAGSTPGAKFGAGTSRSGIAPPVTLGRLGPVNCELPFIRHRQSWGRGNEPRGRVVIGYADGSVRLVSNDELVDPETGKSTLHSLWSSLDPQINN